MRTTNAGILNFVICCWMVLAHGWCEAGAGKEDSPDKIFVAYCKAMKANDFRQACKYVTEESRDHLVQFLLRDGIRDGYLAKDVGLNLDEGYLKRLKEALWKHGILDETVEKLLKEKNADEVCKTLVPTIKDHYAFVQDMAEVKDRRAPGVMWEDSKLQNVAIKETTAKAILLHTVDGKLQTEPILFRKLDGNWRIDLLAEPNTRLARLPVKQ